MPNVRNNQGNNCSVTKLACVSKVQVLSAQCAQSFETCFARGSGVARG